MWLEITGKCQLACLHCYADSGPQGTHGAMSGRDWRRVIDEASDLGVRMVQFIGGEPTMHPELAGLVQHATGRRLSVEIFSNLTHVTPQLWEVFTQPGVRLATSYYSDGADQHEAITLRKGSYARTKHNIVEALRRSIPLRVGLIDIGNGQRVEQAHRELTTLGVTDIGIDRLRQVGRGARDAEPDASQLCGHCARGKVAVSPDGEVWPCVFARWMPLGNVRSMPLGEIATVPRMRAAWDDLPAVSECSPKSRCDPSKSDCKPHCPPGYHSEPKRCWPYYYPDDK